tara:strand:+ start:204 stop:779 length:576 start_codon:yes stop_codon:yes gene_type:complete
MGKMAPSIVKGKYKEMRDEKGRRVHYDRDNWINKKVWYKKTKPKLIAKSYKDGKLTDPYTGEEIKGYKVGEHTVSAKEGHESQQYPERMLSDAEKLRFGHDIRNLKVVSEKTNREKSYYNITGWLPKLNQVNFAKHTETIKLKHGLAMDPAEASKFKEITGRETKTRIAPKLRNTFYCTRCHVKHSIGNHN